MLRKGVISAQRQNRKPSKPPNLQATKVIVRKLRGLRELKREFKPMPRAAAKGLAALPILPYHSKLELKNSIHKSAHIDTNQFVKICDDLWTYAAAKVKPPSRSVTGDLVVRG